jgi:hypothetical protein
MFGPINVGAFSAAESFGPLCLLERCTLAKSLRGNGWALRSGRFGTPARSWPVLPHNMVFTLRPLSTGESFCHEGRLLRQRLAPLEAAAHPRFLLKPRSLGRIISDSTSFGSAWDGCRKNLPLCDLNSLEAE